MSSATSLKGIDNLGQYTYDEILRQNLIAFFDWGFINKAGFSNVAISASGAYDNDASKLRPVTDPRYTTGRVWESNRMNWVWEDDLETNTQPIQISGLFVGSTFHPVSGGNYYIDYPNGRIVFNTGIALNSTVKLAYSYKWINVTSTSAVPWLRKAQPRSFRGDTDDFTYHSGNFTSIAETRMQFPTVAVEMASEDYSPWALGGYQICRTKVKFFIIGEDESSVTRLAHIIGSQKEKTVQIFDSNRLATENKFPLNNFGTPQANFITYPTMVQYSGDGGYQLNTGLLYGKVTFIDSQVQELQELTTNLYQKVVTLTTEAILTGI
jgi:hypothetical protein